MRIRLRHELLLINILVGLFIIIALFLPSNVLRIILGLPLALFLPGYVLVVIFLPHKSALGNIERVALSFGLSIAVIAIIGSVLNFTWGIRPLPVIISFAIFIFVTSLIAWYRRRRLNESERFTIAFHLSLPAWKIQSPINKVLLVILAAVMLITMGTLVYISATPKVKERFTEFYILGPEGQAEDYVTKLVAGEEIKVTTVIVNHEYNDVSYRVEVTIDGNRSNGTGSIILGHEEKWEKDMGITMNRVGEQQKLEFILYKEGTPYRRLHLWVDVTR